MKDPRRARGFAAGLAETSPAEAAPALGEISRPDGALQNVAAFIEEPPAMTPGRRPAYPATERHHDLR